MVSLFTIFFNYNHLISNRAHSLEGPEPAYQQVVSGYETYKHKNEPFRLKYNNKSLNEFQLAYETWGKLNAKKNNAVLIFTGLSASSHAKSHEVCQYF
jgi:homoserine O-acetyltransferase